MNGILEIGYILDRNRCCLLNLPHSSEANLPDNLESVSLSIIPTFDFSKGMRALCTVYNGIKPV